MSVTVVHLLKARAQITANLAFSMADNCFLALFNKLYFFHMKMNRVKMLPVLWGSDFVVVREDINRVTRAFEGMLRILPAMDVKINVLIHANLVQSLKTITFILQPTWHSN